MSKKENFTVIKTEEVNLNFYAVRSQDGKWYRSKGYGGYGDSWVDDITKAKIYSKPGPAKAQVTFWAKNYPEYGVPYLVKITTGVCEYLDQTDRVTDTIQKLKIRDLESNISSCEYRINNYLQKTKWDKDYIEKEKIKLENFKKELEKLKQQ